ncbi:hypothetical protein [Kitasatospora sp. NPDC087271]
MHTAVRRVPQTAPQTTPHTDRPVDPPADPRRRDPCAADDRAN